MRHECEMKMKTYTKKKMFIWLSDSKMTKIIELFLHMKTFELA